MHFLLNLQHSSHFTNKISVFLLTNNRRYSYFYQKSRQNVGFVGSDILTGLTNRYRWKVTIRDTEGRKEGERKVKRRTETSENSAAGSLKGR